MKERQASLPKQEDLQNPTRRLTRSSSRQTQRFITTDLPLVPPRTTTTASNTPGTTRQKRSAAEHEEGAKRVKNSSLLHMASSTLPAIVPPLSLGPSIPSTSFRPALPPTLSLALPPTSLRPNPGVTVPATRATTTTGISFSGARGGVGVCGAKENSSKATVQGGRGGGGGSESDMMDVMRYVDFDLTKEMSNLFKYGSRAGARRGDDDNGSECGVIESPSALDFVNENVLVKAVTCIADRHELLKVNEEVVTYLVLATKQRLRVLIERMIHASRHRRRSTLESLSPPPMYDVDHSVFRIRVGQDVKKQLLAIERVEREEELKYREHVALLQEQTQAAAAVSESSSKKNEKAKKRVRFQVDAKVKKPKVVLTEEETLRFANQTALRFAGNRGRKEAYAWMVGSGGLLKRLQAPDSSGRDDSQVLSSSSSSPMSHRLLGPTRVRSIRHGLCYSLEKVSVKDALFCLEHDCGGEGTGLKVLIKNYLK